MPAGPWSRWVARRKKPPLSAIPTAPMARTCVAAVKNSMWAWRFQSGIATPAPINRGKSVSGTRKRRRTGSDLRLIVAAGYSWSRTPGCVESPGPGA